jgi:hypothetical protein
MLYCTSARKMGQSYLCGCPEAAVPGEVVAVGAASLLLAAGEDEDTEGSGDRAPGCRSRAVRMRHGAGDGGCCFLEPRQRPSSTLSSSSETDAAAVGPGPPLIALLGSAQLSCSNELGSAVQEEEDLNPDVHCLNARVGSRSVRRRLSCHFLICLSLGGESGRSGCKIRRRKGRQEG